MIKKILHQIWNQRWHNSWIFMELLLITIFLWMIIDPLYIIYAKKNIPCGYEKENRYSVELEIREGENKNGQDAILNLVHEIKNMPEIENIISTTQTSILESGSILLESLYSDPSNKTGCTKVCANYYLWLGNKNMFATLGIKDVNTGKILTVPENAVNDYSKMFISKSAAMQLYGTTNVIGRKPNTNMEIIGVYEDFKSVSYIEAMPSIIFVRPFYEKYFLSNLCNHIVQLKKETNVENFINKVNNLSEKEEYEIIKRIKILTLKDYIKKSGKHAVAANIVRQKFIFGSFAILCIFLCITGTFWVRMDNRRSDIGIMCSMGASRSRVIRQYVTEAALLLTAAFIVSLPFILHYVHINGFAEPVVCKIPKGFTPDPQYGVNNFYIHFAWVTAITYTAMLLTTIVGTLIPVLRATRIQPADALREK